MKSMALVTRTLVLGGVVLLAACGQSQERAAAELCVTGLKDRLGEQSHTVDIEAMTKAAARPDGPDIVEINAMVTLDPGGAQPFLCRVQFDAANPKAPPTLLYVQTNW